MPRVTTRDIVYLALFAALTAALAVVPPIPLATGVPITAQSLGPMLAGAVLGARRGGLATLLFLALVAAGLPLLVGGRGGLVPFAGPTAGFLFSWPVAAFVIGALTEQFWRRLTFPLALAITFLSSVVLMYGLGNAWLSAYADLSYRQATLAALPFLPGDLLKAVVAALVAVTVKRSYPIIQARAAQTLGA
ncbi:biotin transport system substrate-specific component [Deinococcus reticulitermitis]|uniref:Biotin transporter n=1 Tax=Deinococcus reticulitermitis TaxID=856736 RepID=A0A1H7CVE5_9DEIO|nr:biotin transporter BioY [Deinococcus reticulitermitis]SEJ93673.1 biotin transport system substrate-specific component [Deinococcus reticulitermitis]